MAKTKISEFDATASGNTDIDGINIAEGMSPGLVNNAFRELMAQLKDFQTGASGDSLTVGGNLSVTGTATIGSNTVDAFPSGTKMLFQQSTAPTGWIKDTTHNNKSLRVVTGTAGSGGSVSFTTAFSLQNVGDTTLTTEQLPSHNHPNGTLDTGTQSANHNHGSGTLANTAVGDHTHVQTSTFQFGTNGGTLPSGTNTGAPSASSYSTQPAGGHNHAISGSTGNNSVDHNHAITGSIGSTGGGASHTHSLDLAVEYVDVIICTKT